MSQRHLARYKKWLRLYPRKFRQHYAEEMLTLLEDQLRDAEDFHTTPSRIYLEEIMRVIITSLRERLFASISGDDNFFRSILRHICSLLIAGYLITFTTHPTDILLILPVALAWNEYSKVVRSRLLGTILFAIPVIFYFITFSTYVSHPLLNPLFGLLISYLSLWIIYFVKIRRKTLGEHLPATDKRTKIALVFCTAFIFFQAFGGNTYPRTRDYNEVISEFSDKLTPYINDAYGADPDQNGWYDLAKTNGSGVLRDGGYYRHGNLDELLYNDGKADYDLTKIVEASVDIRQKAAEASRFSIITEPQAISWNELQQNLNTARFDGGYSSSTVGIRNYYYSVMRSLRVSVEEAQISEMTDREVADLSTAFRLIKAQIAGSDASISSQLQELIPLGNLLSKVQAAQLTATQRAELATAIPTPEEILQGLRIKFDYDTLSSFVYSDTYPPAQSFTARLSISNRPDKRWEMYQSFYDSHKAFIEKPCNEVDLGAQKTPEEIERISYDFQMNPTKDALISRFTLDGIAITRLKYMSLGDEFPALKNSLCVSQARFEKARGSLTP